MVSESSNGKDSAAFGCAVESNTSKLCEARYCRRVRKYRSFGDRVGVIDYFIKHSEPTPIGYAMRLETINQSGLSMAWLVIYIRLSWRPHRSGGTRWWWKFNSLGNLATRRLAVGSLIGYGDQVGYRSNPTFRRWSISRPGAKHVLNTEVLLRSSRPT